MKLRHMYIVSLDVFVSVKICIKIFSLAYHVCGVNNLHNAPCTCLNYLWHY